MGKKRKINVEQATKRLSEYPHPVLSMSELCTSVLKVPKMTRSLQKGQRAEGMCLELGVGPVWTKAQAKKLINAWNE